MKWFPNIVIWHLEVVDNETSDTVQDMYFLFHCRAKRCWENNEAKVREMNCSFRLGGETLYFW